MKSMNEYKHTDAAIEAANDYQFEVGIVNAQQAFLAGVEWAERWIPVSEALPEFGIKVLTYFKTSPKEGRTSLGCCYNGEWRDSGGAETWFKITHWKHLPNPPQ